MITAVDCRKNVDRRSGLEAFTDLEVGKEDETSCKSPKVQGSEGSWPTIVVRGHINEEA